MSRCARVLASVVVAAIVAVVPAPSVVAATATPLGTCKADSASRAVERFTVPGTVTLNADGTPRGQIGATVRYNPPTGDFLILIIRIVDLTNGRVVAERWENFVRCQRLLYPIRELGTNAAVPLTLVRGHAYLAEATLIRDDGPVDPFSSLRELLLTQRGVFLAT